MADNSSLVAALDRLRGVQLASVVFVRDYAQLVFDPVVSGGPDYPRISVYNWPFVQDGSRRLAFGEPGYRDALCARIDVAVAGAAEVGGDVELRFADGASFILRLEVVDQPGPEALYYTDDENGWRVV